MSGTMSDGVIVSQRVLTSCRVNCSMKQLWAAKMSSYENPWSNEKLSGKTSTSEDEKT